MNTSLDNFPVFDVIYAQQNGSWILGVHVRTKKFLQISYVRKGNNNNSYRRGYRHGLLTKCLILSRHILIFMLL